MMKKFKIHLMENPMTLTVSASDYLIKDNCLHLKITERSWKVFPLTSILYYEMES